LSNDKGEGKSPTGTRRERGVRGKGVKEGRKREYGANGSDTYSGGRKSHEELTKKKTSITPSRKERPARGSGGCQRAGEYCEN